MSYYTRQLSCPNRNPAIRGNLVCVRWLCYSVSCTGDSTVPARNCDGTRQEDGTAGWNFPSNCRVIYILIRLKWAFFIVNIRSFSLFFYSSIFILSRDFCWFIFSLAKLKFSNRYKKRRRKKKKKNTQNSSLILPLSKSVVSHWFRKLVEWWQVRPFHLFTKSRLERVTAPHSPSSNHALAITSCRTVFICLFFVYMLCWMTNFISGVLSYGFSCR